MRIAYIGPAWGTSLHRVDTLKRLGRSVVVIDPWSWLGRSVWTARWLHHTGGVGVGLEVKHRLLTEAEQAHPELAWANQGEFLTKGLICRLQHLCVPIVNYTVDNPFVRSAHQRFRRYRFAPPCSGLLVVVREASAAATQRACRPHVTRIWMAEHSLRRQRFSTQIEREPEQCVAVRRRVLADDPRRSSIARRSHERAVRNNLFNEPVMASILETAMARSR